MRRKPCCSCLTFITAFLMWGLMLTPVQAAAAIDAPLRVMTYNVRYASETPPHAWSSRRPLLRELLRDSAPDVIGTQEGVYSQLNDVASDLPGYAWIGLGREGGSRGEFMAVFYRTERLLPLAFDHFWLSDTPGMIGSITWGPRFARMVTWVHFRDRHTGAEFHLWNTHLDHEVEEARQKSAALLRERVARLNDGLPVILLGDFNATAGVSAVHASLVGDGFFRDTWSLASERFGEHLGTFNGFGESTHGAARIDWILVRGAAQVGRTWILDGPAPGVYPSDHYPVMVEINLGQQAPTPPAP